MSLYIGNLSSRTRRDELEHVFQRFGRCEMRMKDGYGFVVYEFPPNAEKALRALQKRHICGEPLTLAWSNKQPKPFKRFARPSRIYEPQRGRDSVRRRDNVKRKLGSSDHEDYMTSIKELDGNIGAGVLGEEALHQQYGVRDHSEEEHHVLDEGGKVGPDPVDNDRWDDQFREQVKENRVDNGLEFDRYEPYQGYDREKDAEYSQRFHSTGSPASRTSQGNMGRDLSSEANLKHSNDEKFRETCYKCGGLGHKMRNCPQSNAPYRQVTRFDRWCDNDIDRRGRGKDKLEISGIKSGKKRRASRDTSPTRRFKNDTRLSSLGKHHMSMRRGGSPAPKKRPCKKNYTEKKRSGKEIGSPKGQSTKKSRRLGLSPLHSDYAASVPSSEHVRRTNRHSRSRSLRSRTCSLSSDSGSISISHYSRSKRSKSGSRSSSPTSLSLSVSLGQPLPSSSNKAQLNVKGSSENARTPESKEVLIDQGKPLEGDAAMEDSKTENEMVALNNEKAEMCSKMENEVEKDQPLQKDNNDFNLASKSVCEETVPSTPVVEKGILAGVYSQEILDSKTSDVFTMKNLSVLIKKPVLEAPASSCSGCSTSISSEELRMIIEHYGLEVLDENEKCLTVEAYFGAARLWPWEVIYYRKLKKGPISTENYARRVEQNREFGIVDKYIRSSSGWGELGQAKP